MSTEAEKLDALELRVTGLEQRVENILTEEIPYIKARITRLEDGERTKIIGEVGGLRKDLTKLRLVLEKALELEESNDQGIEEEESS